MKDFFCLVGPTAVGKSDLAAEVAARCDAEIVSADAFQIYRGLPLLTAQPNESIRRQAPHYLVDVVPLTEELSAARFRKMALDARADISARGKRTIVVGGSGLYVKALTHGLSELPPVDRQLREDLNALSLDQLNARLAKVDSLGAEKIDRRNKRRVVRALEIFAQTGASVSTQEWKETPGKLAGVLLLRDREDLFARLNARVETMFREGVVREVADAGPFGSTAAKALGLAQIRQLLAGEISEAECISAIQQATRRYAKRQLTWFRRQTNFGPLNLSLLKDHEAAVDWILQKAERFFAPAE